jgi:transposase-like protein
MNTSNGARRRPRTDAAQRAQLLAKFARSGLSAAAFARQQGLHYTTFCNWRRRQDQSQRLPAFVQVELPPPAPAELVLELGPVARVRITEPGQVALAVRLLHELNPARPC